MSVWNASDSIALRLRSDDSRATGLTVALLPDGGSAPGDLIELTESATVSGEYDFPGGVTSGLYTLYVGGVVAQKDSENIQIVVNRSGKVAPENTTFGKKWS